jgi:hypothetical protein
VERFRTLRLVSRKSGWQRETSPKLTSTFIVKESLEQHLDVPDGNWAVEILSKDAICRNISMVTLLADNLLAIREFQVLGYASWY